MITVKRNKENLHKAICETKGRKNINKVTQLSIRQGKMLLIIKYKGILNKIILNAISSLIGNEPDGYSTSLKRSSVV